MSNPVTASCWHSTNICVRYGMPASRGKPKGGRYPSNTAKHLRRLPAVHRLKHEAAPMYGAMCKEPCVSSYVQLPADSHLCTMLKHSNTAFKVLTETLQPKACCPVRGEYLSDAHVGPRPHVVGLQIQGFLVSSNGIMAARAVCQRGAKLIPQGVVPWPNAESSPAAQTGTSNCIAV